MYIALKLALLHKNRLTNIIRLLCKDSNINDSVRAEDSTPQKRFHQKKNLKQLLDKAVFILITEL